MQGEKGDQGIKGTNGVNGQTSYFHIKYAPVQSPTSAQMTETPNTFIGTYVDFVATDSTDPAKYTWAKFEGSQGAKGDQGIKGANGANGQTSYLHIAYANNATGTSGFSVSDSTNKLYIGQYTDFASADSTDPTKYSWTLIKGDKGATGSTGATGNGISKTEVFYYLSTSNTAQSGGSWTTTVPSWINGRFYWQKIKTTYTNGTSSESIPACITGAQGSTGASGVGVSSITIEFYLSSSKTSQTGSAWTTVMPVWSTGKYLWTRNKVTYSNSTTNYTTPLCDSSWEAVNEIEIGDRNLVLKSNKLIELGAVYNITQGTLSQDWIPGETYTIIVKGKMVNSNTTVTGIGLWRDTGNVAVISSIPYFADKGLYIYTFKCPNPATTYNTFNQFSLYNYPSGTAVSAKVEWIKIVRGNKPSNDWTPAPEDIQEDIDNSKEQVTTMFTSSIEQTKKEINLKVQSVLESVGANASAISSVTNEIELTKEATSFIKTTIDKLQDVVDGKVNANEIQEWARFDGASLELGASNSKFKAILTNTELGFYQASNKITWISNNELHIVKAVIEEILTIGRFFLKDDLTLGFTIS